MYPIDRRRFDALAGYIRSPWSYLVAQELAWFEEGSEKLLGLVSLDTVDGDFVGTVLARDSLNRFRAVSLQINCPTQFHAEAWLRDELAELIGKPADDFFQGDEKGLPVDFFTPVVASDKLSPAFRSLIDDNGYTPALGLLKELTHHFRMSTAISFSSFSHQVSTPVSGSCTYTRLLASSRQGYFDRGDRGRKATTALLVT